MATKCGKCAVEKENMQRCSKCHIMYYCSRKCQIEDWKKSHKKLCKGIDIGNKEKEDVTSVFGTSNVRNEGYSKPSVLYPRDSCAACGEKSDLKKCARCLVVMYCSKRCQNEHWYQHKHSCQQNQDVVEVIQTNGYKKQMREANVKRLQSRRLQSLFINGFDSARGESRGSYGSYPMHSSYNVDLTIRKSTTKIERKQAKIYVERKFPMQTILDTLGELEEHVPGCFYPHPMMNNTRTSFVGFITRYHYYKQRHSVYVEDDNGKEICVGFYLDYDSPFPYFTWADVRPGKFICIHDPTIFSELSGQNHIRVDEAEDVHLFDI